MTPPSNFKTTKATDMKLLPKLDNYKKFQFDLFLENHILLFVLYDVIEFETIKNNRISYKLILSYRKMIIKKFDIFCDDVIIGSNNIIDLKFFSKSVSRVETNFQPFSQSRLGAILKKNERSYKLLLEEDG